MTKIGGVEKDHFRKFELGHASVWLDVSVSSEDIKTFKPEQEDRLHEFTKQMLLSSLEKVLSKKVSVDNVFQDKFFFYSCVYDLIRWTGQVQNWREVPQEIKGYEQATDSYFWQRTEDDLIRSPLAFRGQMYRKLGSLQDSGLDENLFEFIAHSFNQAKVEYGLAEHQVVLMHVPQFDSNGNEEEGVARFYQQAKRYGEIEDDQASISIYMKGSVEEHSSEPPKLSIQRPAKMQIIMDANKKTVKEVRQKTLFTELGYARAYLDYAVEVQSRQGASPLGPWEKFCYVLARPHLLVGYTSDVVKRRTQFLNLAGRFGYVAREYILKNIDRFESGTFEEKDLEKLTGNNHYLALVYINGSGQLPELWRTRYGRGVPLLALMNEQEIKSFKLSETEEEKLRSVIKKERKTTSRWVGSIYKLSGIHRAGYLQRVLASDALCEKINVYELGLMMQENPSHRETELKNSYPEVKPLPGKFKRIKGTGHVSSQMTDREFRHVVTIFPDAVVDSKFLTSSSNLSRLDGDSWFTIISDMQQDSRNTLFNRVKGKARRKAIEKLSNKQLITLYFDSPEVKAWVVAGTSVGRLLNALVQVNYKIEGTTIRFAHFLWELESEISDNQVREILSVILKDQWKLPKEIRSVFFDWLAQKIDFIPDYFQMINRSLKSTKVNGAVVEFSACLSRLIKSGEYDDRLRVLFVEGDRKGNKLDSVKTLEGLKKTRLYDSLLGNHYFVRALILSEADLTPYINHPEFLKTLQNGEVFTKEMAELISKQLPEYGMSLQSDWQKLLLNNSSVCVALAQAQSTNLDVRQRLLTFGELLGSVQTPKHLEYFLLSMFPSRIERSVKSDERFDSGKMTSLISRAYDQDKTVLATVYRNLSDLEDLEQRPLEGYVAKKIEERFSLDASRVDEYAFLYSRDFSRKEKERVIEAYQDRDAEGQLHVLAGALVREDKEMLRLIGRTPEWKFLQAKNVALINNLWANKLFKDMVLDKFPRIEKFFSIRVLAYEVEDIDFSSNCIQLMASALMKAEVAGKNVEGIKENISQFYSEGFLLELEKHIGELQAASGYTPEAPRTNAAIFAVTPARRRAAVHRIDDELDPGSLDPSRRLDFNR